MAHFVDFPEDRLPLLVSDLDGTLTNFQHRLHFLKDGPSPDWLAFNSSACADTPVAASVNILKLAYRCQWKIVIVTGRSDKYIHATTRWLQRYAVPYDRLFMRADGDNRSDVDVKRDIYNIHLKHRNIQFVMEDRDKLVEMWRGFGLTCLQVQKGAY
jgi:hypothetical protein